MLTEDNLIAQFEKPFTQSLHHIIGIGDDAAVIPKGENACYVISKDVLVENVHFRLSYYDPLTLAHKAIHSNLSDLAAMGAQAKYILLGLSLPSSIKESWITDFQQHFCDICLAEKIVLIGGDTTRSPSSLFISITVIGEAPQSEIKLRSTAQVGDNLCVIGNLGEAYAGLYCLENNILDFPRLKKSALFPNALQQEGAWLGKQIEVTAMMDISDGLWIDSQRLCAASKVGAILNLEKCAFSPELKNFCQKTGLKLNEVMLAGGEDYALLLTVKERAVKSLKAAFEKEFNTPFCKIGKITAEEKIRFNFNGSPLELKLKPFSHF